MLTARQWLQRLHAHLVLCLLQASVTCAITAPIQIPDYKAIAGDKEVSQCMHVRTPTALAGSVGSAKATSVLGAAAVRSAVHMLHGSVWQCFSSQVFSQAKGINILQNKTLRVRRLYDAKHSTLLYVAYSTRLSNDSKVRPLPEASTATSGQ